MARFAVSNALYNTRHMFVESLLATTQSSPL
jgi:hypothetical protein